MKRLAIVAALAAFSFCSALDATLTSKTVKLYGTPEKTVLANCIKAKYARLPRRWKTSAGERFASKKCKRYLFACEYRFSKCILKHNIFGKPAVKYCNNYVKKCLTTVQKGGFRKRIYKYVSANTRERGYLRKCLHSKAFRAKFSAWCAKHLAQARARAMKRYGKAKYIKRWGKASRKKRTAKASKKSKKRLRYVAKNARERHYLFMCLRSRRFRYHYRNWCAKHLYMARMRAIRKYGNGEKTSSKTTRKTRRYKYVAANTKERRYLYLCLKSPRFRAKYRSWCIRHLRMARIRAIRKYGSRSTKKVASKRSKRRYRYVAANAKERRYLYLCLKSPRFRARYRSWCIRHLKMARIRAIRKYGSGSTKKSAGKRSKRRYKYVAANVRERKYLYLCLTRPRFMARYRAWCVRHLRAARARAIRKYGYKKSTVKGKKRVVKTTKKKYKYIAANSKERRYLKMCLISWAFRLRYRGWCYRHLKAARQRAIKKYGQ